MRFDSPEYFAWRYSQRSFRAITRFFAWGEDDAAMFTRYDGYTGAPIHVTGNPRMDLLRPDLRAIFDDEVTALRRRFGRFVLVNTNFSFVNHFTPGQNLVLPAAAGVRVGRSGRGLSVEFATGMAAHQETIFAAFRRALPRLAAAFPRTTFVLRPHPSESKAPWSALLAGQPTVHVVQEGNVVPWLMASQCVVHNGCTTAVEANLLGTPTIAFMPITAQRFDYHLPNSLSLRVHDEDALEAMLDDVLQGRRMAPDAARQARRLQHHLAPLDGPLAADRIVDALDAAGYRQHSPRPATGPRALYGQLGFALRNQIHAWKMARRHHRLGSTAHAHHFPTLAPPDIDRRVRAMAQRLDRFGDIACVQLSQHVFALTRLSQA